MAQDDYAIIIGIDHYSHPPFGPLRGPINDAERFLRWVTSPTGGDVPGTHVEPFKRFSKPNEQGPNIADFQHIINSLSSQPPRRPDQSYIGRRLYMFMAGHGVADDLDESYLLALGSIGIRLPTVGGKESVDDFVRFALFEEIVLFMDCCRTPYPGFTGGRSSRAGREDADSAGAARRFIAYATAYGQVARETEHDGKYFGNFSRALLDGLEGAAADEKGEVTTLSLQRYLETELAQPHIGQKPDFPRTADLVLATGFSANLISVIVTPTCSVASLCILEGATLNPVNLNLPSTTQPDGTIHLSLPQGRVFIFVATDGAGNERERSWKADPSTTPNHVRL